MRQKFLFTLLLVLVGVAGLYGLWLVLKSIYQMISDARMNRELDTLARELAQNRELERLAAKNRLANGCQHDFTIEGGALPPGVCRNCGICRDKPSGECDHLWRQMDSIVPESTCELCGAHFSSAREFRPSDAG